MATRRNIPRVARPRCPPSQGHPSEGYTDHGVVDRYSQVAHAVPQDLYARAAQDALARLSPEERAAFVRMLREQAQAKQVALPRQVDADPRSLGQVLSGLHQTPGLLRDILGGGAPRPSDRVERASGLARISSG
jgi:hypothetical protein